MNLFLVAAVPLAAVILHQLFHRDRPPFADGPRWAWGAVWSLAGLLVTAFFGKWRTFSGDLLGSFLGLTVTDAILVPGVVLAAWVLRRPSAPKDSYELALWLALVFTMAGIRDFFAWSRNDDLHELFLVPLDRLLVLVWLPLFASRAAVPASWPVALGRWLLVALTLLSAPLFAVLSFAHLGWVVWVLTLGGTAGGVWLQAQKKAAPVGSGPSA